jgi:hypothetical protein
VQLRVLLSAGFEMTRAATALGALTVLGFLGLLAVPVVALPVSAVAGSGGTGLEGALWIGVAVLVALMAGVIVLVVRDGPLTRAPAPSRRWAAGSARARPTATSPLASWPSGTRSGRLSGSVRFSWCRPPSCARWPIGPPSTWHCWPPAPIRRRASC